MYVQSISRFVGIERIFYLKKSIRNEADINILYYNNLYNVRKEPKIPPLARIISQSLAILSNPNNFAMLILKVHVYRVSHNYVTL